MMSQWATNPYEPPKSWIPRPRFGYLTYAAIITIVLSFCAAAGLMWMSYKKPDDPKTDESYLHRGPYVEDWNSAAEPPSEAL